MLLSALALVPGWVVAQTTCNGVPATIVGTSSSETITGTNQSDIIAGLGGDDVINGLKGNDLICGDDGNDIINAGYGEDIVYGGRGNDTLNGEKGEDHLYGDLGTDTLDGGIGEDVCDGGVGQDSAPGCESANNVDLLVKKVAIPVPGGFVSLSGAPPAIPAGTVFTNLDGALFVPQNARKVAVLVTHGASGRFDTAIPGWLGWWLELYDVATLSLNRRDSSAYGNNEGGGGTIYEDTLCDAGRAVDYLVSLGFETVIIVGHSKGTTVAPVYPSYYANCPGKSGMTDPNDPNVAGVVAIGTVANSREAGLYAPYGAYYYDVNGARAIELVNTGYGDLLFPPGGFPAFGPPIPIFGPQFFIQPPGFPVGPPPLPAIPITSTPRS